MYPKKILFFSCEPGGAEVLIPVIDLLRNEEEYDVKVLSYGQGAVTLGKHGILFEHINKVTSGDDTIINDYQPDVIITSASSFPLQDMSEKYLWQIARQKGIPCVAFLDVLQGYELRFSNGANLTELTYFPDYINCINEMGKKDLVELGINKERLITFGHPFQSYMKKNMNYNGSLLRRQHGYRDNDKILLFISQPIFEYYGETKGYTQYSVLEYFLSSIVKGIHEEKVIIRLHPKDQRNKFLEIIERSAHKNIELIQNEYSSIESIAMADYVFGMSSTMLTQAYILDKPVISILLENKDEYFMTRFNYIYNVESFSDTYDYDSYDLYIKEKPLVHFEYHFDCDRFLEFLREI
ncbi:polysialyltransferase family glycosyltransferase [Brevibacillus choshinensis]|uniref:polysialyltransferase family glycosyltransferase n=1 Tax=Brevibacillus choshinensis TaxID=54911 RepID=UPI002E1D706C|nr:polysialyltransferase family glycosyltransferase [Brevibacillus choshinensis]